MTRFPLVFKCVKTSKVQGMRGTRLRKATARQAGAWYRGEPRLCPPLHAILPPSPGPLKRDYGGWTSRRDKCGNPQTIPRSESRTGVVLRRDVATKLRIKELRLYPWGSIVIRSLSPGLTGAENAFD